MSICTSCFSEIRTYPCPVCGYAGTDKNSTSYTLLAGTTLKDNRYVVGRVLGKGGFGTTYSGFDRILNVRVAIKEYYPMGIATRDNTSTTIVSWKKDEASRASKESGFDSVLAEARKMEKVKDISGIVSVNNVFDENDTAYIVMEYVEGEDLKHYLSKNGVMKWEEAKEKFLPIITALGELHKKNLVHRDISPDNLMVLADGSLKVLDLGAAKDISIRGLSSQEVIKNGFSPFEQYAQRGSSGPWSDIYALASTIYYSLSGKVLPSALDRADGRNVDWNAPGIAQLPKEVINTLKKALEIKKEDRFQSMEDFLSALNGGKIVDNKQKTNTKSKKPVALIAAGAAAVLAVAIVGLSFGKPKTDVVSEPKATEAVTEEKASTEPEEITEPISTQEQLSENKTEQPKAVALPTIEETELYNKDGIVITAEKFTKGNSGYALMLHLENNGTKGVTIYAGGGTLNGISCDMYLDTKDFNLYPGSKQDWVCNYSLYKSSKAMNLNVIMTVGVAFQIYDSNYKTIDTPYTEIKTSAYGQAEQLMPEPGELLWKKDGVSVYNNGFDPTYNQLILMYKNESDKIKEMQALYTRVEGFEIGYGGFINLIPGTCGISTITFEKKDLQKCGIESIGDIEIRFELDSSRSEKIVIKAGEFKGEPLVRGNDKPVVANNAVSITYKGMRMNKDSYTKGLEFLFLIENSSNDRYSKSASLRSLYINGKEIEINTSYDDTKPYMSTYVNSGGKKIGSFILNEQLLKNLGITGPEDVTEVTGTFACGGYNTSFKFSLDLGKDK